MSENVRNRIEWVDCAKGFAIILVVYGHALTYFSPNFDSIVHVVQKSAPKPHLHAV